MLSMMDSEAKGLSSWFVPVSLGASSCMSCFGAGAGPSLEKLVIEVPAVLLSPAPLLTLKSLLWPWSPSAAVSTSRVHTQNAAVLTLAFRGFLVGLVWIFVK